VPDVLLHPARDVPGATFHRAMDRLVANSDRPSAACFDRSENPVSAKVGDPRAVRPNRILAARRSGRSFWAAFRGPSPYPPFPFDSNSVTVPESIDSVDVPLN